MSDDPLGLTAEQRMASIRNEFWEALQAAHDRLMNERARLILDGVDLRELAMPISPSVPPRFFPPGHPLDTPPCPSLSPGPPAEISQRPVTIRDDS